VQVILNNMEDLIELCLTNYERKEQYKLAVRKHNSAMVVMHQKLDYTDDEINSCQLNIDEFVQVWVQPHSYAGCTNYIHLLSSGYIAEYMFCWRTLHHFSQQGWEHFNSLLKVFFF
jgi:hypothetical protein